jgi:hypothetical protein
MCAYAGGGQFLLCNEVGGHDEYLGEPRNRIDEILASIVRGGQAGQDSHIVL